LSDDWSAAAAAQIGGKENDDLPVVGTGKENGLSLQACGRGMAGELCVKASRPSGGSVDAGSGDDGGALVK